MHRLLRNIYLSAIGALRMPDDILFAEFTQPAVTTVSVPRIEIGRVATLRAPGENIASAPG